MNFETYFNPNSPCIEINVDPNLKLDDFLSFEPLPPESFNNQQQGMKKCSLFNLFSS